ncbi:putative enoyl CoA hydratase [Dimargaris verticillata]|uniref:Enoyl CoA hydratase n=1 Tax=Dimargaris verticillata TaxID=2761393 RepID=A0A9W8B4G2_9FUNG|nr:putative enoyl CoA hydratase [Dimargaris verticillata]
MPAEYRVDQPFDRIKARMTSDHVLHIQLNRPAHQNALCPRMWTELAQCFRAVQTNPDVRSVLLSGEGVGFCSGLDLTQTSFHAAPKGLIPSRKAYRLRTLIREIQAAVNQIQSCHKPVVAAIHGYCIGGGIDLAAACDVRYCTDSAVFGIKDAALGVVADIGTLQRLQKVVQGDSWVREICLTGRTFSADEAIRQGFVSSVYSSQQTMLEFALCTANSIAAQSPITVLGTK